MIFLIIVMSPSPLWPVVLATAAVLEFPAVLQRCISDEVQAGTRVVRTGSRGQNGLLWRETSPGHHWAGQKIETRRMETKTSPQPIRIHGWISRESSGLSEAERRVVGAAVGEAVGRVSGFLSGEEHACTRARTHTHTLISSHSPNS